MRVKLLALCICFFYNAFNCYSQTRTIEQLKKQVSASKAAEKKLNTLFLLCEQRNSLSTDALLKYASAAKALASTSNNIVNNALAEYYIASYLVKAGLLDSALILCNTNLASLQNKRGHLPAWLKFSALKAQVLVKSNKYKEGLAQFYATLTNAEQNNDTLMQMIAKNGIGWVHMEMNQDVDALNWFHRALQTSSNAMLHQKCGNTYSNIAAIKIALGNYDSAHYYVTKSIQLATKDENLLFVCNSLNILADNYIHLKKPALAQAPLEEAIKIREQIGDPFYVVSDLSQLALFYAEQKQPDKGIAASLKGIKIAKKYNLAAKLPFLQFALARNYKAAGYYIKYGETMENILALKDSVYRRNTEQELAKIRSSYNQQKQQNLIIQQKLAINKRNSLIFGALIVVFFGVVISVILFNNYKRKHKMIVESIKQEEKRKAQEAVMMAEENERKRISADLHDNLGAYASAISANVDDLLNAKGNVNETLINNVKSNADDILNSLSETIWVLNKNEIHLTSVSDRFKNYVSRIRDTYQDVSININERIINNTTLSPESALNMLRIMQEAFHNAIKHSKGNSITIDIVSDNRVEISITDNGEGITNTVKTNGHGLRNMQNRASANGWTLQVKSLNPKGTMVALCT